MTQPRQYFMVLIAGAVIGGLIVAIATKALPRIMAQLMEQMMSGMPQRMMAQMKAEGLEPFEMCQRMMANCQAAQASESLTAQSQN